MAKARARGGAALPDARSVFELVRGELVGERRERVVVLMLDARHRLIAQRCVSLGSLMSSVIHPREVFGRRSGSRRPRSSWSTTIRAATRRRASRTTR